MYAAAYTWAKVIGHLESVLGEVVVQTWLDDAEVIELTEKRLVIYSPTDFRQQRIREHCTGLIREALGRLHMDAEVAVWGEREWKEHRERPRQAPAFTHDSRFSFESFVAGSSNALALKVAQAAARDPGSELYNPLYLYGPPGVGKTHLLYAMANAISQQNPEKRVLYIKGEQFTDELIQSIREGTSAEFRRKYRQADVLLVDDIQFIAGKEVTQEEFFHTFNALRENHCQIVLAADRKPGEMLTLEDRLRGRFGEGVMVGLVQPDYDTRLEILQDKAPRLGLSLERSILARMASVLTDSVRQIEGALRKLRAFRDLSGMALTEETVMGAIEDLRAADAPAQITPELILRNVCRYFGVTEETLKGPGKSRQITRPRQVAIYLIRTRTNLSLPEIGKLFSRDHGTIHHALKKTEALLQQKDPELKAVLGDIEANIASCI